MPNHFPPGSGSLTLCSAFHRLPSVRGRQPRRSAWVLSPARAGSRRPVTTPAAFDRFWWCRIEPVTFRSRSATNPFQPEPRTAPHGSRPNDPACAGGPAREDPDTPGAGRPADGDRPCRKLPFLPDERSGTSDQDRKPSPRWIPARSSRRRPAWIWRSRTAACFPATLGDRP